MSCEENDDGSNPSPQEAQQSNPGKEEQLNSVLLRRKVHSSPENGNLNCVGERSVGNLVTCVDFIFPFVGMIVYSFDFGSDIYLAHKYFTEGNNWYFALTVLFILVSAVTMTVLSSVWYWRAWKKRYGSQPESIALWILRVIFAVLLLSPLLRDVEALYFAVMSWRVEKAPTKMKYYKLMTTEGADVALLRLFESFMETAPQLVLLLYILVRGATHMGGEGTISITFESIKIPFSAIALAFAMVIFHRNVRRDQSDAQEISYWASVVHFLAHIGLISSRVLALSLFASVSAGYLYTLLAGVAVHWAVVVGLIWLHNEKAFQSMIGNVAFTLVFAAVHIFTFVNAKEGNTRNRYVFYCAVSFVEDIFLMGFWFNATDSALWFRVPALVAYLVAFIVGILSLIVYYVFLHPVTKGKYATILSEEFGQGLARNTTDAQESKDAQQITLDGEGVIIQVVSSS